MLRQAIGAIRNRLFRGLESSIQTNLLLAGLAHTHRVKTAGQIHALQDVEFKVFSQWGEDGIIQYLINEIDILDDSKIFIEFGVEDYQEANTRFLLMQDNWRGLVIDGSDRNVKAIQNDSIYWKHDITAVSKFITRENINDIFSDNGFEGDIGLLSIDIDGNDYWIWEAISSVRPRIVICEYNNIFGPTAAVSIPYDSKFQRGDAHYSNLYFGASLGALKHLGEKLGYEFIGSNSAGINAFFVRKDLMTETLKDLATRHQFVDSRIRESRDPKDRLSYLAGRQRIKLIRDLMVVEVTTGETQSIENACLRRGEFS